MASSVKKFAIHATILRRFKAGSAALYACSLAKKYGPQVPPANGGQGWLMNEALQALREHGLVIDEIIYGGNITNRVPTVDKPHKKNGWYFAFEDRQTVVYGDYATDGDAKRTWSAKSESTMTAAEREAQRQRREQARLVHEAETAARHKEGAREAQHLFNTLPDCTEHPYLTLKGVKPCPCLKVDAGGRLFFPMYDETGAIVNGQRIPVENGGRDKRPITGARKSGCFFSIGGKAPEKPLCIAEGLATSLSIHEATSYPVLVAIDAGNMGKVAAFARQKYPDRTIILCADNDITTPGTTQALPQPQPQQRP